MAGNWLEFNQILSELSTRKHFDYNRVVVSRISLSLPLPPFLSSLCSMVEQKVLQGTKRRMRSENFSLVDEVAGRWLGSRRTDYK